MKYVVYACGEGFFGWLMTGWFVVKIIDEEAVKEYKEYIVSEGLEAEFRIYKMKPPIPLKFWFRGKGIPV